MTTLTSPQSRTRDLPKASIQASDRITVLAGLTAGLLLQIVLIHLIDQEWFAFAKDPSYVQVGYIGIEITGLVVAVGLLLRSHWLLWLVAFGTAAGPLLGFIMSRSIGMPNYVDDIGNWTEPLGVASVLVEVAVMAISGRQLLRAVSRS